MRNEKTIKLTTGAMFVAIYALILILNRQTGSFFEEFMMYILPIPMVAYSAKYGLKSSIPVFVSMVLISVFFGTITTIFYAASEAIIGMVLGVGINKKYDMTKTLLLVILLSVLANLTNTVFLASVFGYDINGEITELQTMIQGVFEQSSQMTGVENPNLTAVMNILTPDYLRRIFIISMVALGMVQGYLVFTLSLLILNRLKFNIPKPQSIYSYYPPKWIGVLALVLFLGGTFTNTAYKLPETYANIIQTISIVAFLFLVFFGMVGAMLFMRVYFTPNRFIRVVILIICYFLLSQVLMLVGAVYVATDYHAKWINMIN